MVRELKKERMHNKIIKGSGLEHRSALQKKATQANVADVVKAKKPTQWQSTTEVPMYRT